MKKKPAVSNDKNLASLLGYPDYDALDSAQKFADTLAKRFNSHSKKSNFFAASRLCPPIYNSDLTRFDPYAYGALVWLCSAVEATRALYERNDIPLPETRLSRATIRKIIEPNLEMGIHHQRRTSSDISDLIISGIEKLVEGIETCFYLMSEYDPKKTNPHLEAEMRRFSSRMSSYASDAITLAEIIKGFNRPLEYGAVVGAIAALDDKNQVIELLHRGDSYRLLTPVLQLHAMLNHLPWYGNPFVFDGMVGEEISTVIDMVCMYNSEFNIVANHQLSGKQRLVVSEQEFMLFSEAPLDFRGLFKEDWLLYIEETLRLETNVNWTLRNRKGIFLNLADKLSAFGMPYEISKAVADYLSFNLAERSSSSVTIPENFNRKAYLSLLRRDKRFDAALRAVVAQATGKVPNDFSYKRFTEEEGTSQAHGISPVVYVSRINGGSTESLLEAGSKLSSATARKLSEKQYFKTDGDIYVRENQGVCFIFDFNSVGDILNPQFCIVEVRDAHNHIRKHDPAGAKFLDLEVDVHETVHAAQVGSRIF